MFSRRVGLLVLATSLLTHPVLNGQSVTPLTFEPTADSAYSSALDRLILVSASPNLLHIYNPSANTERTVALADVPIALSVSPDGLHAAVGSSTSIWYVNLQTAAIEQTYNVQVGNGGIVLTPQYIYVLASPGGTFSTQTVSINISSGTQTVNGLVYQTNAGAVYDSSTQAVYAIRAGSPAGIEKFDVSTGPITNETNDPYWGDYAMCAPTWLSPDQSRIYTGCATAFRTAVTKGFELTYYSTFAGLDQILSLSTSSALNTIAVIPAISSFGYPVTINSNDNEIRLYTNDNQTPSGHMLMPDFQVNGTAYQAHGKQLFFNSSSSDLYVVMQADSKSGLLYDYAVFSIPMSNPAQCSVTLGSDSASVGAAGGVYTFAVTTASTCEYVASSNSNWIVFSSGTKGTGNNSINYEVRPNTTGSIRTGTISIGGSSLTVTQDGTPNTTSLNPLSFSVVAADYSRALDKVIMVSAAPNELHIYDPISRADSIVPLATAPISVGLSPDGLHAAVGQQGWVTYINLQTAAVENVFALPSDGQFVVLPGNGYIYTLPRNDWGDLFALQMSTDQITAVDAIYDGRIARVSASGNYMYMGQGTDWTTKWDLSAGVPSEVTLDTSAEFCSNFWLSQDGGRIYTGCGTVFRASDSSSTDLAPNGSFSAASQINWVANSTARAETAVLPGAAAYGNSATGDTSLQIYGDAALSLQTQQTLPAFSANGSYYAAHGRYVFWNSSSSKLFILQQADSTANLLSDYAVFALDQTPNPSGCTFTVNQASSGSVSGAGGTVNFNVVASQPACGWSSFLGNNSSLVLAAGAAGTGSGTVSVIVGANNGGAAQSIPLTIAGQSVTFNQDATCSYTITPNYVPLYSAGGSGSLAVSAGAGCPWSTSGWPSWITLTPPVSGVGNGSLNYSVATNQTAAPLQGSYSITGAGGYAVAYVYFSVSNQAAPSSSALRFIPVTPCRIADTRLALGAFGGPILGAGSTREFDVPKSACNIPSTAQAYSINVTAVPPGGIGFLTAYPSGQSLPLASTLNSDGRVKAAATIVPAGSNGGINIYTSDNTHVVLDINGYFVPASNANALQFFPLTPCRLLDTRLANGSFGGPALSAGIARVLAVQSSACNVPSTAQAYSLNYTVVPPGTVGYLTTWPSGQSQPVVSTLNAPHAVTANAAIVPAGSNGSVSLYSSDPTDLVVDIDGYFAPATTGGLSFYAITPCRALDTRSSSTSVGPINGKIVFNLLTSSCGGSLSPAAQAFALNATVVPTSWLGYLTLWPDQQVMPVVSTLNSDGSVASNLAITPTSNGTIDIFTSNPTQVILDVSGYFAP